MPPTRGTTRGAGWIVALVTLTLMVATGPRLAIVWDEGYTLGREARLRLWFHALADPARFAARWHPPAEELVQQVGTPPPTRAQIDTRGKLLFDPEVLAWFWPFAREEPHGHPPFYALVGLVGDIVTPWLPVLDRARLGPMLVFSLTAGALFAFVAGRWGKSAGTVAAGAWILQPNLFGHGHYATYDALLAALWLGAVLAFSKAVEDAPAPPTTGRGEADPARPRWGWLAVFGLLLGCAADTKLTGWFLPLPFLVWVGIYRSRRGMRTLLVGGLIALATVYALNPPWWTEPLAGPVRFFASNLRRDQTIRIKTLFLGEVVSTPDGSLPWYNTLAWTVLVTPLGVLALALTGVGRALRRWRSEPFGLLAVGHWAFLLVLRALPHTPGHDGVRQFLPAFGLLALMAGLGAATAVETLVRAGRVLSAVALGEAAIGLAVMWPVPLSYFSPVVGGLPGATALGMEPTYYWDALDDETLAWLRVHTRPGQKVRFATYPTSWLYLRDAGRLPPGLLPGDPGVWAWYVVQNRPGSYSPLDRALVDRGRPAWVAKKLGIPLLWVFPIEQVEALMRSGPRSTAAGQDVERRESPTAPPGQIGRTVGSGSRAKVNGPTGSLTRRMDLGRGNNLRGRVDHRGRLAHRVPVAEAGQLDLRKVAAQLDVGHVALLHHRLAAHRSGRGARRRGRLAAHRGRRRTLVGALDLVARPGVAGQQRAENTNQSQGQQLPSHVVPPSTMCSTVKIHRFRHPVSLGSIYALLKG
jgi:4-amino-4-deoxy-L-arabinose transferase-like glycosyltransferase